MKTNDDIVVIDISQHIMKLVVFIIEFYQTNYRGRKVNQSLLLSAINCFITEGLYVFHQGNHPLIHFDKLLRNEFTNKEFVAKFSNIIKQDESLITKFIAPRDLLQPEEKSKLNKIPNPIIYENIFNTSLDIMLIVMIELDRNGLLGENQFYQVASINERMLILRRRQK